MDNPDPQGGPTPALHAQVGSGKLPRGGARALAARAVSASIPAMLLRQAVPLSVAAALLWLFATRLAQVDPAALYTAFLSLAPHWWLAALLATGFSFWAVGRYDAVLHRVLCTDVPQAQARRAGIAAIAVSQTLGLGLVTGGLVRWRMLPGFSLWQATQLSAAVGLSFLAGWAVVTSGVIVVLPPHLPWLTLAAWLVLALAVCTAAAVVWRPRLYGRSLPRVPLLAVARIIGLAAIDTGAAALAFWCLVPASAGLGFAELLPAFLLALGAGLLSSTPGGIGPFEMVLLTLLPHIPAEPLLAGVVAFRLVYYALPAMLGGLLMVAGPGRSPPRDSRLLPPGAPGPELAALLASAPRAEAQLLRQGEHSLLLCAEGRAGWQVARTGQALVALSDPFAMAGQGARGPRRHSPDVPAMLADLMAEARGADRFVCLYKCGARTALAGRRAGFHVLPITHEVWLDPASFTLSHPGRSQLRRKLRKAEKAGLRIENGTGPLPLAEMAAISAEWVARHGGERGFSMGRFAPAHLAAQRVYLGYAGEKLVSFLTLHQGQREWALDLMRHGAQMPEGTMHALLTHAIRDAAAQGLPRLSLAAVPREVQPGEPPALRLLHRIIERTSGATGLRQFKASFAPRWEPLYIAAPTRAALLLAGIDIMRGISHPLTDLPPPLPPRPGASEAASAPEDQHPGS